MPPQPRPESAPDKTPRPWWRKAFDIVRMLAASELVKGAFAVVVFLAALLFLFQALQGSSLHEIGAAIRATPRWAILAAVILTPASYACLAVTEAWAVACVGQRLSSARIGFVTFVAYAMSNGLGLSVATGTAARIRLYRAWGLGAGEIGAITVLAGGAVAITGFATAGLVLVFMPGVPPAARVAALALAAVAAIRLAPLPRPVGWFPNLQLTPPPLGLRIAAFLSGTLDWVLSGLTLFVLLPGAHADNFLPFIAIFVLGSAASAIAGVPGGLGVFDVIVLTMSRRFELPQQTAAALVLYRLIFALAPLTIAAVAMGFWQLRRSNRTRRGLPP